MQTLIKLKKKQDYQGSITVYLSLILILILSLIMTVIEGARQTTARVFAERALTTSMDSVFADFYGPLMEEYHLLGLDGAYGENLYYEQEMIERMKDYMSYTFAPKQELSGAQSRMDLYGISIDGVEVKNKTSIMDYQGELFINEITEYMKYKEISNVEEFLLEKVSLIEHPQKVSTIYNEKLKLEEELVAIDEGILTLMKYIDGVSTNRKGILRNRDGSLKTNSNFVKKIMYGEPTMEGTGINNESVFLVLQGLYRDPSEQFTIIEDNFIRIEEINEAITRLESSSQGISNRIEDANASLQELEEALSNIKKGDKTDRKTIKNSIKDVKDSISNLNDEAKDTQDNIKSYQEEIRDCIDVISSIGDDISSLASDCKNAIKDGISELEDIIKIAKASGPMILSYEETLDNVKEGLNKNIYESLKDNLKELKRYELDSENGYNFPYMKEILDMNYEVLNSCISILKEGDQAAKLKDITSLRNIYKRANDILLTYETTGLNIDYSSLVIEDEETPDFLDGVKELVDEGIVSLIIDTDSISDKELIADQLPSMLASLTKEEEEFSFSSMLNKLSIGGKGADMGGLLSNFGDYSLSTLIGDATNEITKGVLTQEYIKEYFYSFPLEVEDREANKPSVLSYEKEYLIAGKMTDRENFESVIYRILLIRTLLNFSTILADKNKQNEAKILASALVGFTGLPILMSITQSVLMILLAFVSGLVDTCALIKGKEVPILKKQIELNYWDLLLINREKIQKEANSCKESKGFSYNDYLTLFLYVTNKRDRTYRMMDLIQENISQRYGTKFYLKNCLFGYEAEAVFSIKPVFTRFSFLQKYISNYTNKPFVLRAEYSY